MPQTLLGVRGAIRAALDHVESADVETTWSMAGPIPGDPDWAGGTVFVDRREITIEAPPPTVFRAVCRIGGGHGWYAADFLWRLRGLLDRLVGGPGLRRGRRDPEEVAFGEAAGLLAGHRLRTRPPPPAARGDEAARRSAAGVRAGPSRAAGGTRLTQTARFLPRGLLGLAYWYAVLPVHAFVFRGMLKGIRRVALELPPTPSDAQ